ncbi:stromal cell-derived factor 2-like protein, partial [Striga asiatica]
MDGGLQAVAAARRLRSRQRDLWKFKNEWRCERFIVEEAKSEWMEYKENLDKQTVEKQRKDETREVIKETISLKVGQCFAVSASLSQSGNLEMGCLAWEENADIKEWKSIRKHEGKNLDAELWAVSWAMQKILQIGWSEVCCQ